MELPTELLCHIVDYVAYGYQLRRSDTYLYTLLQLAITSETFRAIVETHQIWTVVCERLHIRAPPRLLLPLGRSTIHTYLTATTGFRYHSNMGGMLADYNRTFQPHVPYYNMKLTLHPHYSEPRVDMTYVIHTSARMDSHIALQINGANSTCSISDGNILFTQYDGMVQHMTYPTNSKYDTSEGLYKAERHLAFTNSSAVGGPTFTNSSVVGGPTSNNSSAVGGLTFTRHDDGGTYFTIRYRESAKLPWVEIPYSIINPALSIQICKIRMIRLELVKGS